MTIDQWLPLLMLATSLLPAVWIFKLPETAQRRRTVVNLAGAGLKLVLMAVMFREVHLGRVVACEFALLPDLTLRFHLDPLALLFAGLSSVLWLLTTVYAIGYLEAGPDRSRFFGFFSLCVCTTVGIAMAGNLITLLLFYELLSLTTWPLVTHRGNPASITAGRTYLAYTLTGGAVLLVGVIWLQSLAGGVDFVAAGSLDHLAPATRPALRVIFWLLVVGFGVKAALVPLHGWLPEAMAAPAPVSALLHAVAVVKAGAFGIVRVVYDVYGIGFCRGLGLLEPLAVLACLTIVYGSLRALGQSDLKRRLAYSTVSQVSYIILGVGIHGPMATIGGITHLVHQGLMKITLFFCAGNFAETLGVHRCDDMAGLGRRMPLTTAAFTIGALGMIGVPPMAGFVSKWYLGLGGLAAGEPWVLLALGLSGLLNAAYFLPLLHAAWFDDRRTPFHRTTPTGPGRFETSLLLLIPPLITAVLSILAGLFAASPISPLAWSRFVMQGEYGP